MNFSGEELTDVLQRTGQEIELRNEHGRCCRMISSAAALELDADLFVGIGNRRRIRFLRPRTSRVVLNAGSQTTQRMNDGFGRNISHPLVREHRSLAGRRNDETDYDTQIR
jgi:hypothetical protein